MAKNKMGLITRDRILDAAQSVFNEKGFDESKVDDIAALAGVTKAMIYYHFESKEALMLSLIERMLNVIQKMLPQEQVGIDQTVLKRHLQTMLVFWEENKEISAFLVSRGFKDPALFAKIQEMGAPFFNHLMQISPTMGTKKEQTHLRLFFYNALPMMFFPLMKEQFGNLYHLTPVDMNEYFIEKFVQVFYG